MASWEFPCSAPVDLEVKVASGSVAITALPTQTCTVHVHGPGLASGPAEANADADDLADRITVSFADGRLEITEPDRGRRRWNQVDLHVAVTVPDGSRCTVRTAAADVRCEGEPGSLDASTASGDIAVVSVGGPARLTTASGKVGIEAAGGSLAANTASGSIRIGHALQDVTAKTSSGTITIGCAEASQTIRSASGRVRINRVTRGRTDVDTVSGDIEIQVTPGTGVYLDLASLTGRVTSDLEPTDQLIHSDLHVHCHTVSGALRVGKAPAEQTTR